MASLDDAFITQISNTASARNPNAYLANQHVTSRQQLPEWMNQYQNSINNTSFEWQKYNQQYWLQPQIQEWLTPKQSFLSAYPAQQQFQRQSQSTMPAIQNDIVSPQQAAAQIADQHRFQPSELRIVSDNPADSHWWFIRPRTWTKYCYPKRYNYRADDD
jgi:hypothetical protein